MKLATSNNEIGSILHHSYDERETFTLTGKGVSAKFVAVRLNAEPCRLETGRWFTSLDLEQVSEVEILEPCSTEGLPPVGSCACVYDPEGLLMYGAGEEGEVVAHVENTAVIRMSYGLGCFVAKHLRTKEQIEAEEKSEYIEDAQRSLGVGFGTAQAMWFAGYRK